MSKTFNWKISGAAGDGIKSIGLIVAKAFSRHGYFIYGYDEYPSLIRGGHNTYQLLISEEPIHAPRKRVDMFVALNQEAIEWHKGEMDENTVLVVDSSLNTEGVKSRVMKVAALEEAKKLGDVVVKNSIFLGVTAAHFGISEEEMLALLKEELGHKEKLWEANQAALRIGMGLQSGMKQVLPKKEESGRIIMSGTEAVGLGAIAAGVQAYFAYPMTPSSPLLHFMAEQQQKYGFVVRQPEDEIAAINMAIGSSYAGAKSMVGTAGGGFALMQEAMALDGMLELPLVVYVGMRPGPATGLPTWTSQGDLRFVIHSGHGEFPKVVLTPTDMQSAFEMGYKAFALSQEYQIPVVILSDKLLAESYFSALPFENRAAVALKNVTLIAQQPEGNLFHRYQPSPSGVSPRTLPGVPNGFYIANSDEHNAEGLVDESAVNREGNNERRMNKLKLLTSVSLPPKVIHPEAEWMIVSWGSTKGVVMDAVGEDESVGICSFEQVWPLNAEVVTKVLENKKLLFVENNTTGQFEGLIRQVTGLTASGYLRKDTGRPFYVEEIGEFVKQVR